MPCYKKKESVFNYIFAPTRIRVQTSLYCTLYFLKKKRDFVLSVDKKDIIVHCPYLRSRIVGKIIQLRPELYSVKYRKPLAGKVARLFRWDVAHVRAYFNNSRGPLAQWQVLMLADWVGLTVGLCVEDKN